MAQSGAESSSALSAFESESDLDDDEEATRRRLNSPSLARSPAPLDREWAVFVDRVADGVLSKDEYMASLKLVFRFRSLLEFQEKFEAHRVGVLLADRDVSLRIFEDRVAPVWEAPENMNGGKFVLSFVGSGDLAELREQWNSLLAMMCTGCCRGIPPDALVGAVFASREWGASFALWSRSTDAGLVGRIKRRLRKLFDTTSVKFLAHTERPPTASRSRKEKDEQRAALKRSLVLQSPLTVSATAVSSSPPLLDARVFPVIVAVFVAIAAFLWLRSKMKV